jgi:CubicO group peptidase (beta-lactamase class C family)
VTPSSNRSVRSRGAVRLALCAALLLAPLLLSATPLRASIGRSLAEEGIAGAVWAMVDTDGTVRVDATGLADVRGKRPMRAGDRVQVGSITKAVLATGVLRLASEGRLALDAPVTELLPGIAFDNPWEATDPVRLRHLLDHTAGLDDMRLWQGFSLEPTPDVPLARAFAGDPGLLRVRSRPGSRFSYSNMGYTLIGRVIESVTGQRYERYLDTRLLRPLGMHDSTFGYVSQQGAHADPRLAMGHFERGVAQPAVPLYLRPAGQFTTTAADMARFAQFLLGDGRIGGQVFIDPALMRARGHPTGTDAARAGLGAGYALGLAVRDRDGAVGLCHGGNTVGFRAMLCVYPSRQRGFFVAFNADVEGADYARIRTLLVEALDVATPAAAAADPNVDLEAWRGVYVPAPNRFATFEWLDTVFGFVHVAREGDTLRLRTLQSPPLVLEPVGGALLRAPGRTLASHALVVAADGTRVLATDFQSYARIGVLPMVALWVSLVAGLLGLLYVLVAGLVRIARRRAWRDDPLRVPWFAIVALALPVPLFARQPFLQLGDLTLASGLLALVTAALPLAMLVGVGVGVGVGMRMRHRGSRGPATDTVALTAVLQWLAVLAAWGLMPVRLWAW